MPDPFAEVAGRGIAELTAAGITVDVGIGQDDARRLNAPYLKLMATGRPWILAKWAMTLDGKIATRLGDSRWISNEQSREVVHAIRGRVDAIIVGRGTAEQDDPRLTVRPPGPRTPVRIVVDSRATLASGSQLAQTARDVPVLVAAGPEASPADCGRLRDCGCEVFVCEGPTHADRLETLLDELGRRRMTNVLVEGGSHLLGSLLDARRIDEVHVFIAPKLVGGQEAVGPVAGQGSDRIGDALELDRPEVRQLGADVYIHGRLGGESR